MSVILAADDLSNWQYAEIGGAIATGIATMALAFITFYVFVLSGPRLALESGIDRNGQVYIMIVNRGRSDAYVEHAGLATRPRRRLWRIFRRPKKIIALSYPIEYELAPTLDKAYEPAKQIAGGRGNYREHFQWPLDRAVLADQELIRWWPTRPKGRAVVVGGPDQANVRAFVKDAAGEFKFCRVKDRRGDIFV